MYSSPGDPPVNDFKPDQSRTTSAMLAALHDPKAEEAWAVFDARYRPVLIGFARNLGLSDEEAADVAQEVVRVDGLITGPAVVSFL